MQYLLTTYRTSLSGWYYYYRVIWYYLAQLPRVRVVAFTRLQYLLSGGVDKTRGASTQHQSTQHHSEALRKLVTTKLATFNVLNHLATNYQALEHGNWLETHYKLNLKGNGLQPIVENAPPALESSEQTRERYTQSVEYMSKDMGDRDVFFLQEASWLYLRDYMIPKFGEEFEIIYDKRVGTASQEEQAEKAFRKKEKVSDKKVSQKIFADGVDTCAVAVAMANADDVTRGFIELDGKVQLSNPEHVELDSGSVLRPVLQEGGQKVRSYPKLIGFKATTVVMIRKSWLREHAAGYGADYGTPLAYDILNYRVWKMVRVKDRQSFNREFHPELDDYKMVTAVGLNLKENDSVLVLASIHVPFFDQFVSLRDNNGEFRADMLNFDPERSLDFSGDAEEDVNPNVLKAGGFLWNYLGTELFEKFGSNLVGGNASKVIYIIGGDMNNNRDVNAIIQNAFEQARDIKLWRETQMKGDRSTFSCATSPTANKCSVSTAGDAQFMFSSAESASPMTHWHRLLDMEKLKKRTSDPNAFDQFHIVEQTNASSINANIKSVEFVGKAHLVSKGLEPKNPWTSEARWASDHMPVLVEVSI